MLYPDQAPAVTQELEQICQERQVELFRPDLSQVREGERSLSGTAFTAETAPGGGWPCAPPSWGSTR